MVEDILDRTGQGEVEIGLLALAAQLFGAEFCRRDSSQLHLPYNNHIQHSTNTNTCYSYCSLTSTERCNAPLHSYPAI